MTQADPTLTYRRIPEQMIDGRRTGRHIAHDPRSWAYRIHSDAASAVSKDWKRHVPVFDQGNLGSCTGNAAVMALACGGNYEPLRALIQSGALALDEQEAVKVYSAATVLDSYDGQYTAPTWDDTGSDGLSAAKACVQAGLINGYTHAMSLDDMITGLQTGPMIMGMNWYSSFDTPAPGAVIEVTDGATVRGGHEVCVRAVDVNARMMTAVQSWGASWGDRGEFHMPFDLTQRLLGEQGDAVLFTPLSQRPPVPDPTPAPSAGVPTEADRELRKAFQEWERYLSW